MMFEKGEGNVEKIVCAKPGTPLAIIREAIDRNGFRRSAVTRAVYLFRALRHTAYAY